MNNNVDVENIGSSDVLKQKIKKLIPQSFLNIRFKYLVFKQHHRKCISVQGSYVSPYILEKNDKKVLKKKLFSYNINPNGINIIGYIRAEIGLGSSCRLFAKVINLTSIPFTIYNFQDDAQRREEDSTWDHKISKDLPYNINLFHVQPYELPKVFFALGKKQWDYRYNIGIWFWELEEIPEYWLTRFNYLDEWWAPSEFICNTIRRYTDKPVHFMPYALERPENGDYKRLDFGLPEDKLLYLCMYDNNSIPERKNPMGAILAYKEAFPIDNTDIGLVIKVNNPDAEHIKRIRESFEGYPNIYILAEVYDQVKANALIACTDVLVSLHRSEGFGLIPAEAMLLGKPVVATNWSSTSEFMREDNSCLVDYTFTTLEYDAGPYPKGARWAEPDIHHAAEYMRRLNNDETYRQQIGEKAKEISLLHSPEIASKAIKQRISEIYMENRK